MSGVGEMLVVVRVCLKLGNLFAQQLGPLWNLRDDMESMHSVMLTSQAVLSDAEKRSLRKEAESERLWLRKLKSAAYEIEDILSDFEASIPPKMARRRDKIQQQVKLFFSLSNPVILHVTLAYNMKDLKKTLEMIVSEKRYFDFKVDTTSSVLLEGLDIKNRETFSEIDLNHKGKIIGRDQEKERIVKFLLRKDVSEDISTVPIVGLGGLGKTTLAQLVFNDEGLDTEFDTRAWVYVSMDFDKLKIGKTILSQIDSGSQNHDSLQSVTRSLRKALANKQFLIVLDDLWEEDGQKLERLNLMLKGGKHGSKVIVTTRSQRVAELMSSKKGMVYTLEGLSDEYCWSIFSQRAFASGDEIDSSLVEIGREIIKKCKGVPLVAIALGYILSSKRDIAAWSAVRDSDFWEIDDGVLPSLKLSFYQLPAPLKLCFSYCAIFPKGSDIRKDKLIQQWIALEFIQKTTGNLKHEKVGEDYVSILLGMSFLQYLPNYEESQNLLRMHDLVHDLARSVIGDEMIASDARTENNVSIVNCGIYYSLLTNYESTEALAGYLELVPTKIRALHMSNCVPVILPNKVFSRKKSLRVLNLSGCQIKKLPSSIYNMKQLRYLMFQGQN